jgi:8-oxo-dGTP diphosphatase
MTGKPFELSVRAIICDEKGNCLLLRRSSQCTYFAGQWEWPGGKVDAKEDFATALERETAEETGLTVEITKLAGATHHELPRVNVVLLCMEARVVSGELELSEEHEASAWVALKSLSDWDLTDQARDFMVLYGAAALKRPPASNGYENI